MWGNDDLTYGQWQRVERGKTVPAVLKKSREISDLLRSKEGGGMQDYSQVDCSGII